MALLKIVKKKKKKKKNENAISWKPSKLETWNLCQLIGDDE